MRFKKIAVTDGNELRNNEPDNFLETLKNIHDPSGLGMESSRDVGGAGASKMEKEKKQFKPSDAWRLASRRLDFEMRQKPVHVLE